MRKDGRAHTWRAARYWRVHVRRNLAHLASVNRQNVLSVYYEHLIRDAPATAARICDWLGLAYEPPMARFWEHEHHYLGGNRGTLHSLLRKSGATPVMDAAMAAYWNTEFYDRVDPEPFVDDRWKDELTTGQLCVFGLAAGRLHRTLGYPSVMDRDSLPHGN